jgi:hypothetical protein
MKRLVLASMMVAGLLTPVTSAAQPARVEGVAMTTARVNPRPVTTEFAASMRRLWENQDTFTRNFIISSLAGLGDADAITLRLLRNQDDIGNAMKAFYGVAAGDRLAVLLRDHVLLAADVVKAARNRDADALATKQLAWTANADEIATFLAAANPAWSRATLQQLLRRHLELTALEVKARLDRDWTADLEAYEQSQTHMRTFAALIADGVVKQHRRRFVR